MAKLQKQTKQNPKLEQRELKDGRIALYLEYYLGRSEEVVKGADGKVVYYTEGAMKGSRRKKLPISARRSRCLSISLPNRHRQWSVSRIVKFSKWQRKFASRKSRN